ncbi:transposase [Maribellus maritimus]|nr:transposase [Maribellus maritimus]
MTGLIIDESGWEKKGDKSVGVSAQYCGNAGKICNSQSRIRSIEQWGFCLYGRCSVVFTGILVQ